MTSNTHQTLIASDRFVSLDEYKEADLCEVIHKNKDLPIDFLVVVGFAILKLAKLQMLWYDYNCIDKFVDRAHFRSV